MAKQSQFSNDEYTIGWICALRDEFTVATTMFTKEHGLPQSLPAEDNGAYMLGEIGQHKVVMACFPAGRMGTTPAAVAADGLRRTFKSVRFGLLVGIGGAVPHPHAGKDVRLGDVVVSVPTAQYGGVVQYDFGKVESGGSFKHLGHLCSPPEKLLATVTLLQSLTERLRDPATYIQDSLAELERQSDTHRYPTIGDNLFQPDYIHGSDRAHGSVTVMPGTSNQAGTSRNDCSNCNRSRLVTDRRRRPNNNPVIHLGTIASGNAVIKDTRHRDHIDQQYNNTILCFEMEAAGLMNTFPCLVIRGISDYADSHKNDGWRSRAIATSSAYAKALITIMRPADVVSLPNVDAAMRRR
ncbi:hypothetical protein TWF730_001828 [Orbilia blumenaviensis]|uniref:Nucleoside phosphorylase domain-containing protein n=1 Tax=Orbilia blumenaviensis TaxID=1796055 RepID=A0AAV9UH69_9PEZI